MWLIVDVLVYMGVCIIYMSLQSIRKINDKDETTGYRSLDNVTNLQGFSALVLLKNKE